MRQAGPSPGVGGFWRCGQCGTPNPWAGYVTRCLGCGANRPPAPAPPVPARASGFGRWLAVLTGLYAGLVLVVLAVMWTLGDRWWPATALLFLPRAVWLLPLPVLALLTVRAVGWRRGLWAAQAATALVVAGPLMGLHVPLGRLGHARPAGTTLRIMTLNRHGLEADPGALSDLIERERVDLLVFQETGGDIPVDPACLWGWHRTPDHSIFSRFPIVAEFEESDTGAFPEYGFWPVRYRRAVVRLPDGADVVVVSAHLPTPRSGLSLFLRGERQAAARYLDWRWTQVGRLGEVLALTSDRPTLAGCDLNTPDDSPLIRLLRRNYQLAFDEVGWGYGYTRPSRTPWVGIDQILASRHFTVTRCWVGPDVGSDHRPVLAEVVLSTPGRGPSSDAD